MPRLIPLYAALLLILVQLDTLVSWSMTRERMSDLSARDMGLLTFGVMGTWQLACGGALKRVSSQPALNWLRRQPASDRTWGWAAIAAAAPSWPLMVGWVWLSGHGVFDGVLVALPLMILGGALTWFASIGALVTMIGTAALLGVSAALGQLAPWLALLPAALMLGQEMSPRVGLARTLGKSLRLHQSSRRSEAPAAFRPRGPVSAVVARDMLCIIRTRRGWAIQLAAALMLPALLMFALRYNGGINGHAALIAYAILAVFMVLPAYDVLEHLAQTLGSGAMLGARAPISQAQRISALLAVCALVSGPGLLLLLGLAAGGLGNLAASAIAISLLLLSLCCLSLLLRLRWMPGGNGIGLFLLIVMVATVCALLWPFLFPPIAFAAALALCHRCLTKDRRCYSN